jgi:D-alanyl-D-alanine dipeptidase
MNKKQKNLIVLKAEDFLPLNIFRDKYPIHIDIVYANLKHPDNRFPGLYHPKVTTLWMHEDYIPIALLTSMICKQFYGWELKFYDCLRFVEDQKRMESYNFRPDLVYKAGVGGHSRGMAGDFAPIYANGVNVDLGTHFDVFPDKSRENSSHRNFVDFGENFPKILEYRERRNKLETAILFAARALGNRIFPLPVEFFDFRFYEAPDTPVDRTDGETYFGDYAPVYEKDMPAYMHHSKEPEEAPSEVVEQWNRKREAIEYHVERAAAREGISRILFHDSSSEELPQELHDYRQKMDLRYTQRYFTPQSQTARR